MPCDWLVSSTVSLDNIMVSWYFDVNVSNKKCDVNTWYTHNLWLFRRDCLDHASSHRHLAFWWLTSSHFFIFLLTDSTTRLVLGLHWSSIHCLSNLLCRLRYGATICPCGLRPTICARLQNCPWILLVSVPNRLLNWGCFLLMIDHFWS